MFIYEKNKLNKETGVVEQSLNVTFEGNKPVETPDVVITKDGVTGIKSDSNAYGIRVYSEVISIDRYSVDGEIVPFNKDYGNTVLGFTKSFGFNVTRVEGTDIPEFDICAVKENGEFVFTSIYFDNFYKRIDTPGEYIIDMENKKMYFPSDSSVGSYDLSAYLSQFKIVFGFVIGYYGG